MKQTSIQNSEENGLEIVFYKYNSVEFDFNGRCVALSVLNDRDSEGTWEW